MGAGKTTVGRQLAMALDVPFADSDVVLVQQAGIGINEIFARYGEPTFRQYERKIIQQLLDGSPKIVATGGGAFVQPETQQVILDNSISVWLKASLAQLKLRATPTPHRPLLQNGNVEEILAKLMAERYPLYQKAAITVVSIDGPLSLTVQAMMDLIEEYLQKA
jgi:shikimate kinase